MEDLSMSRNSPQGGGPEQNDAVDDGESGLEWKDGIGTLLGSDLKFRKNEFGVIELIMDDVKDLSESTGQFETVHDKFNGFVKTEATAKNLDGTQSRESAINGERPLDMNLKSADAAQTIGVDARQIKQESQDSSATNGEGTKMLMEIDQQHSGQQLNMDTLPSNLKPDALQRPDKRETQICEFSWQVYLKEQNAVAAPVTAFEEVTGRPAFPDSPNRFVIGDLLESVDPLHQSLFCVVSVVEIKGYRMRLHFEGYSTLHDFWVNANDRLIFPCGFCKKSGRRLQIPNGHNTSKFIWRSYAKTSGKTLAAEENFPDDRQKYFENNTRFTIGNKLEAVDRKNPDLTCVATVTDAIDDRILIHFDGWNHNFDYWCDSASNNIHPIEWCKKMGKSLAIPQDFGESDHFSWQDYLKQTKSTPAPKEAFQTRTSHGLNVGMKLEIVDKRNPILIRVASVIEKSAYQIKIHFDGWDNLYDYWIDVDSTDLHPAGWCAQTGHPLQPNISDDEKQPWKTGWQSGCPVPGCRGMGHIKGSKFVGHHSEYGCPYSVKNLDSYPIRDRVTPRRGPKPSAMMSRRMITMPVDKEKIHNKNNLQDTKRVFSLRRASRNSITGSQDDVTPTKTEALTKQENEPPVKRRLLEHNEAQTTRSQKRRDLHYSTYRSALWSAVPNKHLALYWEQCTRFLPGMRGVSASKICKWSSKEVAKFVQELTGQEKYGRLFLSEEIDGEAFLLLTQNDIFKVLNIKFGPTLKIHGAILYAKVND